MEGFAIVYRASGLAEAELVKGYLESEEIPVDMDYESAGPVYGLTMNGLGEVRLRVPIAFADEARAALARRPVPLEVIDQDAISSPEDREEAEAGSAEDPDVARKDSQTVDPDVA
jgi:hypothetical protein